MTSAEMNQAHFLTRLSSLDKGRDGMPTQEIVVQSAYFPVKYFWERMLGLVLLVPAIPVIGVLAILIRLTSRGPGLFSQVRVGEEGQAFTMYKLRSMRMDAEVKTGPAWSPTACDPRATKLGYWLRKLHLDELPQLFNVVRGEMSLIGPRPERPEFVQLLAEEIPGYLNRLMVKPGITGLAQINLPPDTELESVRRKLVLDQDYIRTATAWLDARIILCTALRMIWIKGPTVTRLLGLERPFGKPLHEHHDSAAPIGLDTLVSNGPTAAGFDLAPQLHAQRVTSESTGAGSQSRRLLATPETTA